VVSGVVPYTLYPTPYALRAAPTTEDGVLAAWEIFHQIRLRAELVVLAACDSGRGESVRGAGVVGLTRALQQAGAGAVVASRWPVRDSVTRRLMVEFHRRLRRGAAKDAALQEAAAAVRRDPATSHPYYWAGFFLTGDPGPLNLPDLSAGGNISRILHLPL
jgi:CHAT domain-containing protein